MTKRWPQEYFVHNSQVKEDLEQDTWLAEMMAYSTPEVEYVEMNGFRYPLPIKKVPNTLRRKQSGSSLSGSGEQENRESKATPYKDPCYTTLLEGTGSFMREADIGFIRKSKDYCRNLLELEQTVPRDSLFCDHVFDTTCRNVENRNEARVIQDIARLIVPSAETIAIYGATHLEYLIEGVNEGWTGCIAG